MISACKFFSVVSRSSWVRVRRVVWGSYSLSLNWSARALRVVASASADRIVEAGVLVVRARAGEFEGNSVLVVEVVSLRRDVDDGSEIWTWSIVVASFLS